MSKYRAVLLDVDGTLINSNDAHAKAWVEAFEENGYRVGYDRVRPYIGMGSDHLLRTVLQLEKDTAEGKVISQRHGEIFKLRYMPALKPFRGARELLKGLHRDGYLLIAATSAEKEEADALLDIVKAKDLFTVITTSADAEKSKPDPDIINAALWKSRMKAEEAIMIGDTPYDIQAANSAGVKTIAFRSGGWDDKHLQGAVAIYDGPADLLLHCDQSPLARYRPAAAV